MKGISSGRNSTIKRETVRNSQINTAEDDTIHQSEYFMTPKFDEVERNNNHILVIKSKTKNKLNIDMKKDTKSIQNDLSDEMSSKSKYHEILNEVKIGNYTLVDDNATSRSF